MFGIGRALTGKKMDLGTLTTKFDAKKLSEPVDGRGMPMLPDAEKVLAVCRDILSSEDGRIFDRRFILDAIRRFGIMYNDWSLMEQFADWKNSSEFGLLQYR